jgi:catechol 2,3-dioxygenase-like lactoylglutathione lyase family enzyme
MICGPGGIVRRQAYEVQIMADPNLTLLYVAKPKTSRAFYAALLDRQPVQESDNFAAFALDSGLMLGLWARDKVEPAAPPAGVGAEIVFPVADYAAVDALCADWRGRGLSIAMEPKDLDFGRTFVALDPDGHRLRVFAERRP